MPLFTRAARAACACPSLPTRRLPLTGRIEGGNKPKRKIRIRRACLETSRRRNVRGVSVAQRRSSLQAYRLRSKLGRFQRRKRKTRLARTVLAVVLSNPLQLLPHLVLLRVWWTKTTMRASQMRSSFCPNLTVHRCTRLRYPMAVGTPRHLHGRESLIAGRSPHLVVVLLPLVECLSNVH